MIVGVRGVGGGRREHRRINSDEKSKIFKKEAYISNIREKSEHIYSSTSRFPRINKENLECASPSFFSVLRN